MAQTMKAVRLHGAKDLRLDEVPIPEVKPGQVKVCKESIDVNTETNLLQIQPAWTGICGTGNYSSEDPLMPIPKKRLTNANQQIYTNMQLDPNYVQPNFIPSQTKRFP